MASRFKIDGTEYDIQNLTEKGKAALVSLQFATKRMEELNNMQSLLQRAKNSYIDSLKKEMLSNKAGVLFGNN